jgi:hypothetical protein
MHVRREGHRQAPDRKQAVTGFCGRVSLVPRLFSGPLHNNVAYRFYGRGADHYNGSGGGVMRFFDDTVSHMYSYYFDTKADAKRICRGDSGGPFFVRGTNWQFGVLSGGVFSGECAKVDDYFKGARISSGKMTYVNDWRGQMSIPACREETGGSWTCE